MHLLDNSSMFAWSCKRGIIVISCRQATGARSRRLSLWTGWSWSLSQWSGCPWCIALQPLKPPNIMPNAASAKSSQSPVLGRLFVQWTMHFGCLDYLVIHLDCVCTVLVKLRSVSTTCFYSDCHTIWLSGIDVSSVSTLTCVRTAFSLVVGPRVTNWHIRCRNTAQRQVIFTEIHKHAHCIYRVGQKPDKCLILEVMKIYAN